MEFHSHCSKRHCIELIYFKLLDEDCFLDLEFGEAMPHLKRLGDTGLTNDQVLHAIKCWMVAAIDERQVFGPKVSITLFLVPWTLETGCYILEVCIFLCLMYVLFEVFVNLVRLILKLPCILRLEGNFLGRHTFLKKSMSFWGGNEYRIMYEKMWVNHPAKNLVPLKVLFKLDSLIGGNYHIFTVSSGY